MRRDEALAILASHRDEIRAHHVTSLSIFGSVARDEAGPESDIDVLVEFSNEARVGLFEFIRLKHYLEEILGRDVELVEREAVISELRDRIYAEAVSAA